MKMVKMYCEVVSLACYVYFALLFWRFPIKKVVALILALLLFLLLIDLLTLDRRFKQLLLVKDYSSIQIVADSHSADVVVVV